MKLTRVLLFLVSLSCFIGITSHQPHLFADAITNQAAVDGLKLEVATLSEGNFVPGRAMVLSTTIRNRSSAAFEEVEITFFNEGRALAAPILLSEVQPESATKATLLVRPVGVGRFTFAVSANVNAGRKRYSLYEPMGTFTITALPGWWTRLDAELSAADDQSLKGNHSAMPALAQNQLCQSAIRKDMVLQRHGEALLAGSRALQSNAEAAKKHFGDALAALSEFAGMLYCINLDDLRYWDNALASFWRSIHTSPEKDLNFEAAVMATWNPALLVLDAIQFTGHSEIIAAYQDLRPEIDKAIALYPKNSYGAAWLDAFGNGQLYRHAGTASLEKLLEIMQKPQLLGFGSCPLTAHAEKTAADIACLEGLAFVTQNCSATSVKDILAGLNETGMLLPLLHGNFAAQSSSTSANVQTIAGDHLGYFGSTLADTVQGLCSAIQGAGQPQGLQGMAEALGGVDLAQLGGCGLALVQAHISAQRTSGDRAVQCIKGLGTQTPKSPLPVATQVRFPSVCAVSDTTGSSYLRKLGLDLYLRSAKDPDPKVTYTKETRQGWKDITTTVTFSDQSSESITMGISPDGTVTDGEHTRVDSNGNTTFKGYYTYDPGTGALTESYEVTTNPDGSTTTNHTKRDRNGNLSTNVTDSKGSGENYTKSGSWTPGPEGENCPQTAAQARAMAMFNCLFAETTEVMGAIGIAPVIQILGETGPLPAACDELDMGALWGSTTGEGVTDPVPWSVSGGPIILQRFIPQVHGVIDPPKDWQGVPRSLYDPQ